MRGRGRFSAAVYFWMKDGRIALRGLALFDNTGLSLRVEARDNKADGDKWSHVELSVPVGRTVRAITEDRKLFLC